MIIERISIEPSRRCLKSCAFCYNAAGPDQGGCWSVRDVIEFGRDCARYGTQAISFGGGEPLEWPGIFPVLAALQGALFRSLTTNGRCLEDPDVLASLVRVRPEKIHISVHSPEQAIETEQVIALLANLQMESIAAGVNVLVRRSNLDAVERTMTRLRAAGIGSDRVLLLPLRGPSGDSPLPAEIARVAGGPFRSTSCLTACARSPRFASVDADRRVAWCSFTTSRAVLARPTYAALIHALEGLELRSCSESLPHGGTRVSRALAPPGGRTTKREILGG